ncbi:MAG: pectate lyase [Hyphomonadaceae bacterium]|nr:pectate lyase [Hyphomonadaceae bacterium]
MNRRNLLARAASGAIVLALPTTTAAQLAATNGSVQAISGWTRTRGGAGGQIIRVTTLAGDGEGSFKAAVSTPGPRTVVFEVGGVIDLGGQTLRITEPFLTIAGQTAPSPGITLIRGGIDITTHDVIFRHIRVRPGEAGAPKRSGRDFDSISTIGARDVIVDQCTLTWGTDENLSASGPRFTGDTPEAWRAGTSHRITFTNNLIAESLSDSTHAKGEHSKGSLIHDNASDILIHRNIYAHNVERNPLFKGGVRGAITNNLIYNPGHRAIHYNLMANEWGRQPFQVGRMTVIGNALRGGNDTDEGLPLVMLGGQGDLALYLRDNIAVDRHGAPLPATGTYTSGGATFRMASRPLDLPAGLVLVPARTLERELLTTVGARPWDRDAHDIRILADIAEGRGHVIDSEADVGGYPVTPETRRPFEPALWNLETMEPLSTTTLDSGARARGT